MTDKPNDLRVSRVGEIGKYDEVLKPFMRMTEKELHANAGKGDRPGWLKMSADTCLLEIYYHQGKLQKAVRDGDGDRIVEYAADVANLTMMLTDICGALGLFAAAQPADQQVEPVAWMHLMHQELDQKRKALSFSSSPTEVFGKPDVDYDACFSVTCDPLYRHAQPATAKVDERAEFDDWTISQGRVLGYTGWSRDFAIWQARAKLNGASKLVLPERKIGSSTGRDQWNACIDEVIKLNGSQS